MHMHDPANPLRCAFKEHIADGQLAICNSVATRKQFHEKGASTADVLFPIFRYFEWLGYNWEPDVTRQSSPSFVDIVAEFMNNIYEEGNDNCDEERDI